MYVLCVWLGVVVTNDNQTLAVALTSTRQLQFYHINDLYNKLSHVQSYHTIQLDMAVDNLNIDPISGDIIVAGHPIVWQFVQHNHAPHAHHSPNQVDRIAYLGNHRYANVSSNVLTDAGELLSASSAAEQHNQYLYVGGVTSKGQYHCTTHMTVYCTVLMLCDVMRCTGVLACQLQ